MAKILGLDLGTNSIGISLRNTSKGGSIENQLEYFGVARFQEGVGREKSGEYSYAAKRTKKRSARRLYQARKYRIWATLRVLIENGYCPLSIEDLEKWCKYDSEMNQKRQYPINATKFEQWVRLDFDGDGIPEYTSPYQLRAELMECQFDFENEIDRYKFGRALYHIAQRRGFRSSKGETLKEQEGAQLADMDEIDISSELKKSEEEKSKSLVSYMKENNLKTVGCAYYALEKEGIRIRNSIYQAVRSQYKDEINAIFNFQNGLSVESDFYKRIISEKKGEGTIFYKRPLRSQKGLVGNCTLEPDKSRCPISHPEYEKFRAWCFINTIKYRLSADDEWINLDIVLKQLLYKEKFLRIKKNFKFEEIRTWIEEQTGKSFSCDNKTINYKDNTNVSGCPISARLKNILGDNWETWTMESDKERVNKKNGVIHKISYDAYDIWHVCFSFDEPENIEEFALKDLKFGINKAKQLVRLYGDIQQGYAMLSLKAIKNINRFLLEGLIYSDAVLLAKLPDIFGDKWAENENSIITSLKGILSSNKKKKRLYEVVNTLIADYKSLEVDEQFAYKNYDYKLQDSDYKYIGKTIVGVFGDKTWSDLSNSEQNDYIKEVSALYQQFFLSHERDYYKLPKVADELAKFISSNYDFIDSSRLRKIYHPSMIEYYTSAKEENIGDGRYLKLLGSPVNGALKNPMAMRMLYALRKQINMLLKETDENGNALIAEDTRVVVEVARELNDANKRWAIEAYQRQREEENKVFEAAIKEYYPARDYTKEDIDNVRLLVEQFSEKDKKTKKKEVDYKKAMDEMKKKYKLWLEQGCQCLYTGKIINIENLFDDNAFDFEHTLPRSKSFDNSLANLTVCDAYYNRAIKKNHIPTQLPNYEKDVLIDGKMYTAIKPRLKSWFEKVDHLKDNVEFWKGQSKQASTKDRKDYCIRQRHLWQMELEYWQDKLSRFTMTEIKNGFRNSQLVDTQIITKYAYHYLKTVFDRVEVQKGEATAAFRKIFGLQSTDEKKDRSRHSHHAIDATMLTLIPSSTQRVKIMELFYNMREEQKDNGKSALYYNLDKQLKEEIVRCGIKGANNISTFIDNNILINHLSKDQTLSPAHKRMRVRGKVVWMRNADGNIIKDANGNNVPKRWLTGDCIRGQLHGETFYGAVRLPQRDADGKMLRNADGSVILSDETIYVVRKELSFKKNAQDSGFASWEELEKVIVDKPLYEMMRRQFGADVSFKEACEQGIFMFDKKGNKINRIRHIRCKTSVKNPLAIKRHTYLSDKPYKQNYYAEVGDLYMMCKYENEDKTKKEYHIWSCFDISENRKLNNPDIPDVIFDKKNQHKLHIVQQIKTGDMLLLYKDSVEELYGMDNFDLSNRLYCVRGFESDGNRIVMQKHINSQPDKELGKGESIKDYNCMPEKIRCGINTLKYLLKDVDFVITPKGLKFLSISK